MATRVNLFETIPALIKTLGDTSQASNSSSLEPVLKNLIEIRASQLNGCTFCLDMHVKQAKINGERELRLYHVPVWRESPLFSAREKAALALTEALTRPAEQGVSEAVYREVREYFTDVELAELAFAIAIINSWNRLMILSQTVPGALDKAYRLDSANLQ